LLKFSVEFSTIQQFNSLFNSHETLTKIILACVEISTKLPIYRSTPQAVQINFFYRCVRKIDVKGLESFISN